MAPSETVHADPNSANRRDSLRVISELNCSIRPLAEPPTLSELGTVFGSPLSASGSQTLDQLRQSFVRQCEGVSDRAVRAALETLAQQVNVLRSDLLMVNMAPADQQQDVAVRTVTLSFDGMDVQRLASDRLADDAPYYAVLLLLPSPDSQSEETLALACCFANATQTQKTIGGPWACVAQEDLRRMRRYVLLMGSRRA